MVGLLAKEGKCLYITEYNVIACDVLSCCAVVGSGEEKQEFFGFKRPFF